MPRDLTIDVPPALDEVDPRLVDCGVVRHGLACWTYWWTTHDASGAGGVYYTRRAAGKALQGELEHMGVA